MFVAYDVWFIKTAPHYNVRRVHFCMFQKNQEHHERLLFHHRDTENTEKQKHYFLLFSVTSVSLW
jgi:hypothetical protein